MAPWNLHERKLSGDESVLFMDQSFPLVFYHFSKYNLSDHDLISNKYNRYNFESNIDLKSIYQNYSDLLLRNGIQKISTIPCHYMDLRKKHFEDESKAKLSSSNVPLIKRFLKKIILPAGIRIFTAIRLKFHHQV